MQMRPNKIFGSTGSYVVDSLSDIETSKANLLMGSAYYLSKRVSMQARHRPLSPKSLLPGRTFTDAGQKRPFSTMTILPLAGGVRGGRVLAASNVRLLRFTFFSFSNRHRPILSTTCIPIEPYFLFNSGNYPTGASKYNPIEYRLFSQRATGPANLCALLTQCATTSAAQPPRPA